MVSNCCLIRSFALLESFCADNLTGVMSLSIAYFVIWAGLARSETLHWSCLVEKFALDWSDTFISLSVTSCDPTDFWANFSGWFSVM